MLEVEEHYIDTENSKPVLWLGNGINRSFNGDSWENMIEAAIKDSGCRYSYEQISKLPATMQIVAATNDDVSGQMKAIAESIRKQEISEEYKCFIKKYLASNMFDTLLTTNYSYELELSFIQNYSLSANNSKRRKTIEGNKRENQLMLYRYNSVGKEIWHIHGEACTPSTMTMGHYNYGYIISLVSDYISKNMPYWNACINAKKKIRVKSWVDYFLICDVYTIGFGMDLSEQDFWWLVCAKKRNFPETKIYVYEPNMIGKKEKIMMDAYGIIHKNPNEIVEKDEYKKYYERVAKELLINQIR